jgi:hypothetical protein
MATRKSNPKRPTTLKEKVRPEDHRWPITSPQSDSDISSSGISASQEPALSSRQPSWTFSLNGLIRLDWSHKTDFYHQVPGISRLKVFGYHGHIYRVQSLGRKDATDGLGVSLLPNEHYYVVPIYEGTSTTQVSQRLLLVRDQTHTDDPDPHVWVIEPSGADPTQQTFAYLRIIGGENDMVTDPLPLHPVGIVEAVLTNSETAPAEAQVELARASATPPSRSSQTSLTKDERASLRKTLEERFSGEELKTLAFDLGVGLDTLPDSTISVFSRELVAYFERTRNLGLLVKEAFCNRNDEFLSQLIIKLGPCTPRSKVQVFLRSSEWNLEKLRNDIAALLGIDVSEIEVLAAASGSLRLLVGLPQQAADQLSRSDVNNLVFDGKQVISATPFDSLDGASKEAWRSIARQGAKQTVSWSSALRSVSSGPDPDLLACIDYFHEAKAIYTNCGPALTRVQDKFYTYLRDKFGYTAVPIDVGTTRFSDMEGHRLTERPIPARLINVPPRVIARVLKDGYKQGQTIKRWAEVVTNQPPVTMLRRIKRVRGGRFYVEIETPSPLAIEQLIDEATGHFRLIDGIYAVLALVDSQSSDLNSLAVVLQRYTESSLPLDQVTNRLYEQLKQIGISRASMRLHYALSDAPRDQQFEFIVIGHAKLLDETREIIIRQAARQDGRSYFVLPDVEWLKTRLRRLRQIDDQTAEALARGIATFLGNMAFAAGLLDDQLISTIELAPTDPTRGQQLTPDFMASAVSPYLLAIANIQAALDRIRRKESGAVIITALQANPIRVNFRGGLDAVRVIREDVLPWRRDNAWQTDGINTRRIRMKDLEKEAKTSVTARARMNLLRDEIAGREESLKKDESDLALDILQKNGLALSKVTDADKKELIKVMLPALAAIIDSELQIAIG